MAGAFWLGFSAVAQAAGDGQPASGPRQWLRSLVPGGTATPVEPASLPAAGELWTIEFALARALQANPDVQVALANVQRQDGVRLQSVAAVFPRIGVSASTERRESGLIDRSPGELSFPPSQRTAVAESNYDVRMELRQTVFDGLAGWHQLRRAAVMHKKASVDARELFLRVASLVRQAYDTIVLRQAIVATRREAVKNLMQLSEAARKRFAVGEISEFESLRALAAVRSAEAEQAQAESDLARAEEGFCRMLSMERPVGGVQLAGQMAAIEYHESFESAFSRAQAGRLDLRSAELQLEAAKMGQRAVKADFLPRIEAFVDYGYRSSYYDVHRQLEGWSMGLVGRWDIFESGQGVGALRTQRADRRIAEIRLAETRRVIGSQVRELFVALDQSRTLMSAHASARDLGERSLKEARRLYEVGRISIEQVLNAELAHRQSLIGWLGAVFTFNTTVYQLDYASANEAFLDRVAPGAR